MKIVGNFRYLTPQEVDVGRYAMPGRCEDFVLGQYTATRADFLTANIRKHRLEQFGIGPQEYMQLADITGGKEGTHRLHKGDREFTIIVRGHGRVKGESFGIVRVVRVGKPSKNTLQPVFTPNYGPQSIIPYRSATDELLPDEVQGARTEIPPSTSTIAPVI